jgi:hypothetical protein
MQPSRQIGLSQFDINPDGIHAAYELGVAPAARRRSPKAMFWPRLPQTFHIAGSSLIKSGSILRAGDADDPSFPSPSLRGLRRPDVAGHAGAGGILRHRQL